MAYDCSDKWAGGWPSGPNPSFARQTPAKEMVSMQDEYQPGACCARCLWYDTDTASAGNTMTYVSRRYRATKDFFRHGSKTEYQLCTGFYITLHDDMVFEWSDLSTVRFVPVDSTGGFISFDLESPGVSSGISLVIQENPCPIPYDEWDPWQVTSPSNSPDHTTYPLKGFQTGIPVPLDDAGNSVVVNFALGTGGTVGLSYQASPSSTRTSLSSLSIAPDMSPDITAGTRRVLYHTDFARVDRKYCDKTVYVVSQNIGASRARNTTDNKPIKVWCGAPQSLQSNECQGDKDLKGNYGNIDGHGLTIGTDRGCIGYGRCPIGPNGQVCSGRGTCLPSGVCMCLHPRAYSSSITGIGPACEVDWTDVKYYTIAASRTAPFKPSCRFHNPCFGNGVCVDVDGFATCPCFPGWVGNPDDGLSRVLYQRQYACPSSMCTAVPFALTGAGDVLPVIFALRLYQCAVWFDPDKTNAQRYFDKPTTIFNTYHESDYVSRPLWVTGPSDPQLPPNQLHITGPGYACADRRSTNGSLYGGAGCQVCPSCNVSNSACIQDPSTPDDATARVCDCYPNFGNSYVGTNKTRLTCDKPICPIALGGICGNSTTRGTCVFDPLRPLTGRDYIGYCKCEPGYAGSACEIQICPTDDSNIICGIGTRAFSCSNSTCTGGLSGGCGTCVCNNTRDSGWINGAKRVCEVPRCPLDGFGNECGGQTRFGTSTNVCDRSPSRICECWAALQRNPDMRLVNPLNTTNGRWGQACEKSYASQCKSPTDTGVLCNNGVGVCDYTPVVITARDPGVPPVCTCGATSSATGAFCEKSACGYQIDFNSACKSPDVLATTGICVHTCPIPGQTQCDGGTYACSCLTVDNTTGLQCGADGVPFSSKCKIFTTYDPSDPSRSSPTCSYDLGGCTSCSSTGCTVCSNIQRACSRSVTGSFSCSCPSGFSGDYCQITDACAGIGGCAVTPGTYCNGGTCACSAFFTGTRCEINACTSSGGLYSVTAGVPACNCAIPSDPYAFFNDTLKICTKQCPVTNGSPCGADRRASLLGRDRCSNHTTPITSPYRPMCDCAILAQVVRPGGLFVGWSPVAGGSCEPYCKNGGLFSVSGSAYSCSCLLNWIGSRCTQPACSNGGIVDQNDNLCQCNQVNPLVDFPFTRASACNISACAPNGTYVVGQSTCSCLAPFVASHDPTKPRCIDPCAPYGTPSLSASKCVCDPFHYGPNCKHTDCYPDTITGSTCTCVNGGTWNGSTCAIPRCQHGGLWSPSLKACNCPSVWGGYDCSADLCAVGGNGAATLGGDGWFCNCDEGYYVPSGSSTGNCSASHCEGGTVSSCYVRSTGMIPVCTYPSLFYNCQCNPPSVFRTATNCDNGATGTTLLCGVCIPPDCGFGVVVVSLDGSGTYKCQCDAGWGVGPSGACTVNKCTSNEYPDWSTGNCECYPPFVGADCTADDCGEGALVNRAPLNATDQPGVQFGIDDWKCTCSDGYITGVEADKYGIFPCVRNCNKTGTRSMSPDDVCKCNDGYSGVLCNVFSGIPPPSSPSASSGDVLSTGAIAGLVTGGVVFIASVGALTYFAIANGWCSQSSIPKSQSVRGLISRRKLYQ